MSLLIISTIITVTAKIIGGVLLIIFSLCVGYRLWVEPFKGVCNCATKLHGKVVLITGGNSGIGFETAKNLAQRGARVIIASRNDKKSEEAVEIIKQVTGNSNVEYRNLDLAIRDSIIEFAKDFNRDFHRLDILVNNAGCGVVKANSNTEKGTDLLMQINYVGPFLLTQLLLEKLSASKPSRIVIVSSFAHIYSFNFKTEDITKIWHKISLIRYANTKLCVILWARELAKTLPHGVTVNVLRPGIVRTNIYNRYGPVINVIISVITYLVFKNPTEGAQTIIHLCVCPKLENSTGGYYVDCKKTQPALIAENDELAKKLWERTLELM